MFYFTFFYKCVLLAQFCNYIYYLWTKTFISLLKFLIYMSVCLPTKVLSTLRVEIIIYFIIKSSILLDAQCILIE